MDGIEVLDLNYSAKLREVGRSLEIVPCVKHQHVAGTIGPADAVDVEYTNMYKRMAEEARAEGFDEIAAKFELVGAVEAEHEKRYLKLLDKVKGKKVFIAEDVVMWRCRNCGHVHIGKEAPEVCPTCAHPQAYFEIACCKVCK